MADLYTAAEVTWLLSMTRTDAIKCDSSPRDSWPDLLASGVHSGDDPNGDSGLLVVVRWNDVHIARQAVQGPIDREVTQLRAAGYTEDEIGVIVGVSQQTVSRRFRASIEAILDRLNVPG